MLVRWYHPFHRLPIHTLGLHLLLLEPASLRAFPFSQPPLHRRLCVSVVCTRLNLTFQRENMESRESFSWRCICTSGSGSGDMESAKENEADVRN